MVKEKHLERIVSSFEKNMEDVIRQAEKYWNLDIERSTLSKYFVDLPDMWRRGEKSCRSAVTVPLFEIIQGDRIPIELENTLISFDVKICTFDELLDRNNLDSSTKGNLIMSNLTSDINLLKLAGEKNEELVEAVKKYIVNIMQIPIAENVNYGNFLEAESEDKELKFAELSYNQRARDIEIFYDLLDIYLEKLDYDRETTKEQVLAYRKLELLEKDLSDLESDIRNDEKKIPVALQEKYDDSGVISRKINKLRERLYNSVDWKNNNEDVESYFKKLIESLSAYEKI